MVTAVRKITTKNNDMMAFVAMEDKGGSLELIVFPRAYEKTPHLWEVDRVIEVTGKINTKDRDGNASEEIKVMVDEARLIDYDMAKIYKPDGSKKAPSVGPMAPVSQREMYARKAQEQRKAQAAVPPTATRPTASTPTRSKTATQAPPTNGAPVLVIKLASFSTTQVLTAIKDILAEAPGENLVYLVMPGSPPKKILLPIKVKADQALIEQIGGRIEEAEVSLQH
jgi:hypothetical protein